MPKIFSVACSSFSQKLMKYKNFFFTDCCSSVRLWLCYSKPEYLLANHENSNLSLSPVIPEKVERFLLRFVNSFLQYPNFPHMRTSPNSCASRPPWWRFWIFRNIGWLERQSFGGSHCDNLATILVFLLTFFLLL